MEGLWAAKSDPNTDKSARPGSTGRGREGVKPLPRGKRGSGKKDSWKEGAPKPPVAQRAGGIRVVRGIAFPNFRCCSLSSGAVSFYTEFTRCPFHKIKKIPPALWATGGLGAPLPENPSSQNPSSLWGAVLSPSLPLPVDPGRPNLG